MADYKTRKKISMRQRLSQLVMMIVGPMTAYIFVLIGILVWHTVQYNTILDNVTTASAFNQDFKENIDLKMFYYIVESAYSEGLPIEDVEAAKEIAEKLLETTTQRDSIDAIESVRDLCITLEDRMNLVAETNNYDERLEQLENNIYILTDLIQTYMSNYLYYESVYLSHLQSMMEEQIRLIILTTLIGLIILMSALLIYYREIARQITEPLDGLAARVEEVSKGDLEPKEHIIAREKEIQTLSDGLDEMIGRINNLLEENKVVEQKKRKAELELLQAQINPHFLYNTLDTIIWLIESGEKEKSVDMVNSLSNFFRFSLSRGRDVITLQEEERHVKSYLEIQKTRYRDRMDYEIDIPKELYEFILPKLTLQPLVENSIYHGIKMQREKGTIRINAADLGDTIQIVVEDNGAGMTEERLAELKETLADETKVGFGLRTVHERIRLLFGEQYGLAVESKDKEGTKITIIIPKDVQDQKENAIHE